MNPILIVEDDLNLLEGLKDNLEFEGYEVKGCQVGGKALGMIRNEAFSLVILDIMLPDISGFEICKTLRSEGHTTPIILLSARSEEMDKVKGLELGADDYITKPFSLRELTARIKAVLRRVTVASSRIAEETTQIGKLTIDFQKHKAFIDGKEEHLTYKELEIIKFLFDKRNEVVKREDIIDQVWEGNYNPTHRTIDNFILKIRHKIETDPANPEHLITVHGVGYKYIDA